jgi:hypothetical protein
LGRYPFVSVEEARAKAMQFLSRSKSGANPIHDLEKSSTAKGFTVAALATSFSRTAKARFP